MSDEQLGNLGEVKDAGSRSRRLRRADLGRRIHINLINIC